MTGVRVGVLGAGSWGTAIAALLAGNGHDVVLWSFEEDVARTIREGGRNEKYLKGVDLPPGLGATDRIAEAVAGANVVVSV
ncbi:MAG TPA: 2-dehydropantoate 2-reductase N-terminal domain-containing protein, partial [Longimicrobiales bacterium]|nr:2-dehydropantoate 2-reductase N-terminal domain-containing protein [Longimicrobiales bacterium]